MSVPLVYLASPYTHPDRKVRQERADGAAEAFAHLMREGILVYSPIASTHHVAEKHALPGDWAFWKTHCHRMIDACDSVMVLTLPGHDASVGVREEIRYARETGKTVAFLDPETWQVTE